MKLPTVMLALLLCGCASPSSKSPALHDGRYGDYNSAIAEKCAEVVMGLTDEAGLMSSLFNKCVFDMGITI